MQPQLPADLIDILLKYDNRIAITEKSLTNDAVPIGAEFDWPAAMVTKLPWNYKVADGSAQDRVALASYFSLVGTTFGVGDGSTTFNLPNYTIPSNVNLQVSYVEFTSPVGITASTESTAQIMVTSATFTANGTDAYWVETYYPIAQPGVSGSAFLQTELFDSFNAGTAASLGHLSLIQTDGGGFQSSAPHFARRRLTPASGTHQYSMRVFAGVANGTVWAGIGGSGNYEPGYILVTSASNNTTAVHVKIVKVL